MVGWFLAVAVQAIQLASATVIKHVHPKTSRLLRRILDLEIDSDDTIHLKKRTREVLWSLFSLQIQSKSPVHSI
jgi:hypothetical protein